MSAPADRSCEYGCTAVPCPGPCDADNMNGPAARSPHPAEPTTHEPTLGTWSHFADSLAVMFCRCGKRFDHPVHAAGTPEPADTCPSCQAAGTGTPPAAGGTE